MPWRICRQPRTFTTHQGPLRAIGETDSRHRRPLSPDLIIQGLATLDAVLATPTIEYLATADEKTQRLSIEAHLFKDKHPVGVDQDRRFVMLYVATEACSQRFLAFLQRQQALLRSIPAWTLRIVVPSWPVGLDKTYLKVAHTELSQVLSPKHVDVLRTYFEQRRAAPTADAHPRSADFERARRAFRGERFEVLYRRWLAEGDSVVEPPRPRRALKGGTGIESSSYVSVASLLLLSRGSGTTGPKGKMAASLGPAPPLQSTLAAQSSLEPSTLASEAFLMALASATLRQTAGSAAPRSAGHRPGRDRA